jgi:hypothetical protein
MILITEYLSSKPDKCKFETNKGNFVNDVVM